MGEEDPWARNFRENLRAEALRRSRKSLKRVRAEQCFDELVRDAFAKTFGQTWRSKGIIQLEKAFQRFLLVLQNQTGDEEPRQVVEAFSKQLADGCRGVTSFAECSSFLCRSSAEIDAVVREVHEKLAKLAFIERGEVKIFDKWCDKKKKVIDVNGFGALVRQLMRGNLLCTKEEFAEGVFRSVDRIGIGEINKEVFQSFISQKPWGFLSRNDAIVEIRLAKSPIDARGCINDGFERTLGRDVGIWLKKEPFGPENKRKRINEIRLQFEKGTPESDAKFLLEGFLQVQGRVKNGAAIWIRRNANDARFISNIFVGNDSGWLPTREFKPCPTNDPRKSFDALYLQPGDITEGNSDTFEKLHKALTEKEKALEKDKASEIAEMDMLRDFFRNLNKTLREKLLNKFTSTSNCFSEQLEDFELLLSNRTSMKTNSFSIEDLISVTEQLLLDTEVHCREWKAKFAKALQRRAGRNLKLSMFGDVLPLVLNPARIQQILHTILKCHGQWAVDYMQSIKVHGSELSFDLFEEAVEVLVADTKFEFRAWETDQLREAFAHETKLNKVDLGLFLRVLNAGLSSLQNQKLGDGMSIEDFFSKTFLAENKFRENLCMILDRRSCPDALSKRRLRLLIQSETEASSEQVESFLIKFKLHDLALIDVKSLHNVAKRIIEDTIEGQSPRKSPSRLPKSPSVQLSEEDGFSDAFENEPGPLNLFPEIPDAKSENLGSDLQRIRNVILKGNQQHLRSYLVQADIQAKLSVEGLEKAFSKAAVKISRMEFKDFCSKLKDRHCFNATWMVRFLWPRGEDQSMSLILKKLKERFEAAHFHGVTLDDFIKDVALHGVDGDGLTFSKFDLASTARRILDRKICPSIFNESSLEMALRGETGSDLETPLIQVLKMFLRQSCGQLPRAQPLKFNGNRTLIEKVLSLRDHSRTKSIPRRDFFNIMQDLFPETNALELAQKFADVENRRVLYQTGLIDELLKRPPEDVERLQQIMDLCRSSFQRIEHCASLEQIPDHIQPANFRKVLNEICVGNLLQEKGHRLLQRWFSHENGEIDFSSFRESLKPTKKQINLVMGKIHFSLQAANSHWTEVKQKLDGLDVFGKGALKMDEIITVLVKCSAHELYLTAREKRILLHEFTLKEGGIDLEKFVQRIKES